jgi:adenylate cyclase
MAIEIEKKFLIKEIPFKKVSHSEHIKQGYIVSDKNKVIRVREKGKEYFITIKGEKSGISRFEFEYRIPEADAIEIFQNFCQVGTIEKTRHYVKHKNHTWEIDEFHAENHGLIVAEIELIAENEVFEIPSWVSKEVTSDSRYYNMNLIMNPFKNW